MLMFNSSSFELDAANSLQVSVCNSTLSSILAMISSHWLMHVSIAALNNKTEK